jgi:hypothetical protein
MLVDRGMDGLVIVNRDWKQMDLAELQHAEQMVASFSIWLDSGEKDFSEFCNIRTDNRRSCQRRDNGR